jgi:DNA-binding response OmpR family regulator
VYALSTLEPAPAIEPLHVGVVTLVTSAAVQQVVAELRSGAVQVDVLTAEVLHAAPKLPIYIFSVDVALGSVLAATIAASASASTVRPGLIGLVDHGTPHETEMLLAAGFDDAVLSPTSPRELAAGVRALHRRVHWKTTATGRLRFGDLTLDLYGRALWVDGRSIVLTSVELAVLRELITARGRPLSRTELLDLAWGEGDLEVSERAVDNVILRLRRKLPRPELIETVRSVGFRIATR